MQCERVKLVAEFFPDFAIWLAKVKSPRFLEEAENALSGCSERVSGTHAANCWTRRRDLVFFPLKWPIWPRQLDLRAKASRRMAVADSQETFACLQVSRLRLGGDSPS